MGAREIVVIATGANKARAVKEGVEGSISASWTISKLQEHESWLLVVDEHAAGELRESTIKVVRPLDSPYRAGLTRVQYFQQVEEEEGPERPKTMGRGTEESNALSPKL